MSLAFAIGQKVRMRGSAALGATGMRKTIPAPVGGWNTRDALADMKPRYATKLDNFFPERGATTLRRGCVEHCDGFGASNFVHSLFSHNSNKLFAIADNQLWDATSDSATSVKSGLTNEFWDTSAHGGATIMVNGFDAPIRIERNGDVAADHEWEKQTDVDGTLDLSKLFRVMSFKGRLFFIEKETANLWYGDIGAIKGDLRRFSFEYVNPAGGQLINMGTLTIDAGSGIDDLCLFFFDNGSVLVYQGVDISDAEHWSLVGRWEIGRLIGTKPLVKVGGDLVAVTSDGYIPLAKYLQAGRVSDKVIGLSDAISATVTERFEIYGDNVGWDSVLFTPASWLLFNIPISGGEQHVMNTQTRAWCRFKGWDARCFAVHNDRLFFGTQGKVCEANVGLNDDGVAISGDVQTAYNYLGSPADKRFTMARAQVSADADVRNLQISTSADFSEEATTETFTDILLSGSEWDVAEWDEDEWAGGIFVINEWQQLNRSGSAISIRVQARTSGARISFFAADVIFEKTTGIL